MPKTHKHEGTFGGSPAALVLDKILCGINNEALIRKIGRRISWAVNIANRLKTVPDKGFRVLLIRYHRTLAEQLIDNIDGLQYGINDDEFKLIKSYIKNVVWTILRQANKEQ